MVVITMGVIAPLALFSSELSRFYLAKQQLRAVIESGALGAASANANFDATSSNLTGVHQEAQFFAQSIIQQNSILTTQLAGSVTQTARSASEIPRPNQLLLSYIWLDADGTPDEANGKVVRVTGAWGYVPAFASFTPIKGPFTIFETADGGLPKLDVVLCFDLSSSMDDFTKVSIVNRHIDPTMHAAYTLMNQTSDSSPNSPIFLINGAGGAEITGSPVNGYYPQCLEASTNCGGYNRLARDDAGTPPPPPLPGFTDLVVNPDADAVKRCIESTDDLQRKDFSRRHKWCVCSGRSQ